MTAQSAVRSDPTDARPRRRHLGDAVASYTFLATRMSLPEGRVTEARGPAALWDVLAPLPGIWVLVAVIAVLALISASDRAAVPWRTAVALLIGAAVVSRAGDIRFAYIAPSAIAVGVSIGSAGAALPARFAGAVVGPLLAIAAIVDADLQWVVVPDEWGGASIARIDALAAMCPAQVPYRRDGTTVIATSHSCG